MEVKATLEVIATSAQMKYTVTLSTISLGLKGIFNIWDDESTLRIKTYCLTKSRLYNAEMNTTSTICLKLEPKWLLREYMSQTELQF